MSTILQVLGVAVIVAGVCLINIAAGVIVAGAGLILIGLAVAK